MKSLREQESKRLQNPVVRPVPNMYLMKEGISRKPMQKEVYDET